MTVRTIIGDCRAVLPTLPADSVHCVVTSPPYWGLRDYGVTGQIGLEPTIAEFVAEMVAVFREVRRVLRPDGTCWINLGDSYSTVGSKQGGDIGSYKDKNGVRREYVRSPYVVKKSMAKSNWNTAPRAKRDLGMIERLVEIGDLNLKPKDLCGIPWRVAFALQDDGWWLRQDIIWAKPNPMPESVTDRCTKAHEYLFLLTKSARYFYDAEAIKEPLQESTLERGYTKAYLDPGHISKKMGEAPDDVRAKGNWRANPYIPVARNKRSVWTVATAPFSDAHFATFPPKLIEPCIKAGTSEKGCCAKCGAPWERIEEKGIAIGRRDNGKTDGFVDLGMSSGRAGSRSTTTLGWKSTCKCKGWHDGEEPIGSPVSCTVLDPFGGAGTTGLVADRLQRNAILIELNPAYAGMSDRRVFDDAPLFAEKANGKAWSAKV